MHADNGAAGDRGGDAGDELTVFLRHGVAHRVGQIDGTRSGVDHGQGDLLEVIIIGARGVLGGELDVLDVAAGQRHRRAGLVENLLAGFFELVLKMDVAGGNEGVNARAARRFERGGGAFHIQLAGARERGDAHPRQLVGDSAHGFKIAFGGDRKAGLQDVDAQLGQLVRHAQLLGDVHAAAGRLFAVAQRGVKNEDAIPVQRLGHGVRLSFVTAIPVWDSVCRLSRGAACRSALTGCFLPLSPSRRRWYKFIVTTHWISRSHVISFLNT